MHPSICPAWIAPFLLGSQLAAQAPAEPSPAALERRAALASGLDVHSWRLTTPAHGMPRVAEVTDESALSYMDSVRGCTAIVLSGEAWPRCTWTWHSSADRPDGPAAWLELAVTLTPGGGAAREHLLASLSETALATDVLLERYRAAERPADLGPIALLIDRPELADVTLVLLRGNLVLQLRGRGSLAASVRPLAFALDRQLAREQELTPSQLRAESKRLLGE